MGTHSKISPSGSSRWLNCPGSVSLIQKLNIKDTGSIWAEEGSLAHAIAEKNLILPPKERKLYNDAIKGQSGEQAFGMPKWGSFVINDEMIDYVTTYVDYVVSKSEGHWYLAVEDKLPLFYEPQSNGTSDAVSIVGDTLNIFDLKYGKGVKVVLIGEYQLPIYAISAIDKYNWAADINTVTMHIVQPRMNNIVSETMTVEDLEEVRMRINLGAELTEEIDAPLVPGEKQCMWCPAKNKCTALAEHNLEIAGLDFENLSDPILPEPDELTDEQIRDILDVAPLIENWLKSLRYYVYAKLTHYENFPGYKLVQGQSRKQWADQEKAYQLLRQKFSRDKLFDEKFISPAKANKLLMNSPVEFRDAVSELVIKPLGKTTLARESDPRPSLTLENEFSNLDE